MYSGSVQITQVDINICQLEQHMEQSNQINNAGPLLLKNYDHLEKLFSIPLCNPQRGRQQFRGYGMGEG